MTRAPARIAFVIVAGLLIGLAISGWYRTFLWQAFVIGQAAAWIVFCWRRRAGNGFIIELASIVPFGIMWAFSAFSPRLRQEMRQMSMKQEITREDILPFDVYAAERKARRAKMMEVKKRRRMEVGPFATLYFENYETMWHQVHEMLHIERGGDGQIEDELRAYNPLIPKGKELVATVMFEIDDDIRRANVLARLGGVEETAIIQFDGETVKGEPEEDVDRTNAAGKASSVQFIHFPFTPEQIEKFSAPGAQILIGFGHENYGHMAVMPDAVRESLARDFA